ncbi:MAG: selenocysteine-specific translation elongation factor [Candidatus Eisenbacteria bacterium]|uniref:Selenocysteine-specific elongation factor n=1 Tax=Eiseniibacteriota bacterium TaxID=2212470 RepID=A0A538T3Z8_UNCEI|nr:MAG: selenocysteine-specific translation elongation factor [Candidatus Eisenbacteria bacterium]
MRPVVVGTAGHIDHGKTALVRRLTGIDTDRLKEEKERGISIDLGFAHQTLPSGRRIAIVDVPGHERFVKNMLAGATGIDLVLLVVAADEGVMPQTREHLAIVNLLNIDRGVVALTKSDLVDPGTLAAVRSDVEELLGPTPLRGSPVVPVSAATGEGIDALVAALDQAVAGVRGREAAGPARLPIDRVFPVEGIGTVVTGTLWNGTVRPGDSLELLPAALPVRVRQAQVHDQTVGEAQAGQRVALAIHGISRDDVRRGDWLTTPGRYRPSRILDVRLGLLVSAPKALGSRSRLRCHLGSSEILGRAVLLERETLAPGEECWAQLRLEGPAVAAAGDRIVIRSYSPASTIAGATVVDPAPSKRARLGSRDRARLETLWSGSVAEKLAALADEAGPAGIAGEGASVRLGTIAESITEAASSAVPAAISVDAGTKLVRLRDGRLLTPPAWSDSLDRVVRAVARYGEENRLRNGIPKGELKSLLGRDLPAPVFDEALELLLGGKRLVLNGDRVALPDAAPRFTPEQERALADLERKLSSRGFQVPEVSELERDIPAAARPGELIRYLADSGRAVKITSQLLYPRALWEDLEGRVRSHFRKSATLTMAAFKETIQVSRKYAVPILEHLDRTGLTRRRGDERVPGPRLSPPQS